MACARLVLILCMLCAPVTLRAHALDPGYLSLRALSGNTWHVFWRKPDVNGAQMAIDAVLPGTCAPPRGRAAQFDGAAWRSEWVTVCSGGLIGTRIGIAGLEAQQTDVLVRVQRADGLIVSGRATPGAPWVDIPDVPSTWQVFKNYGSLGVKHILEGLDHLLFVFALLILIRRPAPLIAAITSFTIAHSVTLAAATLGAVSMPPAPVEAVIALSIVMLAVAILRGDRGKDDLSAQYPWVMSFLFGLLHGFGFSGALTEIGLPQTDIPMALLAFNIGVEAGQLAFVATSVSAFLLLRALVPHSVDNLRRPGSPGTVVMGYTIGTVSVYWLAERVAGF